MLDRRERVRVEAQLGVVVGVRIDEPGRDHPAGRVEHPVRVAGAPTDGDDLAARIEMSPWRPGSPEPSTISPLRMTRSSMCRSPASVDVVVPSAGSTMLHGCPTSSSIELTPARSSEAVHASSSSEIVDVPPLS